MRIRKWDLPPGTRVYATPNRHLQLSYYGGIPVQSTAPVRKAFFDSYPGDVVIVERARNAPLAEDKIRRIALEHGLRMTRSDARRAQKRLLQGNRVIGLYKEELWEALASAQREATKRHIERETEGIPIFRGFELADFIEYWDTFFYRFVDPASRTGELRNYRDRIRNSESEVLLSGSRIYRCGAREARP